MEFLTSIFLGILTFVLGLIWIRNHIEARKFPPGPWGFPIVGYLPFLGNYAYETFLKLGETYGSIFSVVLGNQRVIVLNDWVAVKAALIDQGQTFSGRPPMFIFDSTVKKRDIATNHGPIWKAQRNFAIQTLKQVGPERADRESLFMESINKLTEKFQSKVGKVICIEDDFYLPVFNIVWKLACNKTIGLDDEKGKYFYEILRGNFHGFRNNSPINFMPYLRYLVPGGFGYWTYLKYHNLLWSYIEEEIDEHLDTFKEGEYRDFLDAYIEEIHKRKQRNEKLEPPYTIQNAAGSLYDIFLGGVETTTNTLAWSILLLSVYPEIQDKIQAELDSVIGRGRIPVLDDMPMLPYLEAVTQEIHRQISLVPLSFFHSPLKDTEVLGYPIPKGSTVIQNIYGVHRDPKIWDKPFEFCPERFLDANNEVKKSPCVIPFSVGPRLCFGEALAKQAIFLFLACILQKLSFRLPSNAPQPSLKPIVGFTLTPQPFSVIINTR